MHIEDIYKLNTQIDSAQNDAEIKVRKSFSFLRLRLSKYVLSLGAASALFFYGDDLEKIQEDTGTREPRFTEKTSDEKLQEYALIALVGAGLFWAAKQSAENKIAHVRALAYEDVMLGETAKDETLQDILSGFKVSAAFDLKSISTFGLSTSFLSGAAIVFYLGVPAILASGFATVGYAASQKIAHYQNKKIAAQLENWRVQKINS